MHAKAKFPGRCRRGRDDHTAALARREVRSAAREMWSRARQGGPAAARLTVSAVLALASAASAYRLSLRLLERRLSPAGAAFAAVAGYGTAAGAPPGPGPRPSGTAADPGAPRG